MRRLLLDGLRSILDRGETKELVRRKGKRRAIRSVALAPAHFSKCAVDLKTDRGKLQVRLPIIKLTIIHAYR